MASKRASGKSLLVLGILLGLAFSPGQFTAVAGSSEEDWYGALVVTTEQGQRLLSDSFGLRGCRVVALVSFNFDDGYAGVSQRALPIFQRYETPASAYLIVRNIGEPGYMNLGQLRQLYRSGWEIGSHSMTHTPLTELSLDKIRYEVGESKRVLQALGFQISGFASPFGKYNDQILDEIRLLYDYHRTATPGLNPLPLYPKGPGSRYELLYIEVKNNTPPEEIMEQIAKVNREGGWLIITFHRFDEGEGRWSYSSESLEKIVRFTRVELNLCTLDEIRRGVCLRRQSR